MLQVCWRRVEFFISEIKVSEMGEKMQLSGGEAVQKTGILDSAGNVK